MSERNLRPPADRTTPWELVFAAPGFDARRFELLRQQADAAGAHSPAALLLLPAAGELLRELGGEAAPPPAPGEEPDAEAPVGPPVGAPEPAPVQQQEVIAQVGALLFQGYRFWRHGRYVYDVAAGALEAVLGQPAAGWSLRTPAAAGYVRLPHHLFWGSVAEGAVPEPVDGFFWSAPDADERAIGGTAADRLDLLLVLGLRPGRPGLSLVQVAAEPALQLERWIDVAVRPDGEDFANVLPGGELQGYRALTTRAEALKLAMICFRLIDSSRPHPVDDDAGDEDDQPADGAAGAVRRVPIDG